MEMGFSPDLVYNMIAASNLQANSPRKKKDFQ